MNRRYRTAALERPIRSVYFVPGNQQKLIEQAPSHRPDAVVLDLQASVPPAEVSAARASLADHVETLRAGGQGAIFLRVNEVAGDGIADLTAVAGTPVDAVVLPNATPEGVRVVADILDRLDWPVGVIPVPETPAAMARSLDLFTASERVVAVIAGSGPRWGDAQRVLGFEWSAEGLETLFLRSQYLLHARAAGLEHIIGCAWANLEDTEGLRRHIHSYRSLGYTGYVALHPSQIAVINDVFTPDEHDVQEAHRAIEAFADAESRGSGVIELDGEIIALQCGRAMAHRVLSLAQAHGVTAADPSRARVR